MRGQTESLATIIWGEILVIQLFDGLTKFYFVNWRTGVVISASVVDFFSFHVLNLFLEHASEERVCSDP